MIEDKDKVLQVNYRTKKSRKEEILYIIERTSPKYRSINQFLDMAVDLLLREEVAAITRKEVYQHEHKRKDDASPLGEREPRGMETIDLNKNEM